MCKGLLMSDTKVRNLVPNRTKYIIRIGPVGGQFWTSLILAEDAVDDCEKHSLVEEALNKVSARSESIERS